MSVNLVSIILNERQKCDLELLLNGAFNPLKGFMKKEEYNSVLDNMKLLSGDIWPMPITLDISKNHIEQNNLSWFQSSSKRS